MTQKAVKSYMESSEYKGGKFTTLDVDNYASDNDIEATLRGIQEGARALIQTGVLEKVRDKKSAFENIFQPVTKVPETEIDTPVPLPVSNGITKKNYYELPNPGVYIAKTTSACHQCNDDQINAFIRKGDEYVIYKTADGTSRYECMKHYT